MRVIAILASIFLLSFAPALHGDEKFRELFNGRDLTGWKGDERIWSVEVGLLTGKSTSEMKLEHNTFAIWTGGEVDDFLLCVEFRLEGDNNSGVQYRSRLNPQKGPFSVIGYQADIHPAANYTGMLYDEGGRGIAAERGQRVVLGPGEAKEVKPLPGKLEAADLSKWNKLEVKAVGNRLVHKLNGKVTVDVTDNDPENAEARGILALQVHAGPPMKVQFKSVKLKPLSTEKSNASGEKPVTEN